MKYHNINKLKKNDGYYFYKHYYMTDAVINDIKFFSKPTFRYSLVEMFNDPFELKSIAKTYNNRNVKTVVLDGRKLEISEKIIENINSFIKDLPEICRTSFPICCVNNKPLDLLLWAHYANSHKGFMVEYKLPLTTKIENLPYKVIYNNKYPINNIDFKKLCEQISIGSDLNKINYLIESMLLNKSKHWEYEEEHRFIIPLDKYKSNEIEGFRFDDKTNYIYEDIKPENISSIILGINSENDPNLIKEQLKDFNPDIKIYKPQLLDNQYKIVVPDHPRLNK